MGAHMSQVRYHPLGPLLSGEGSRAFLGLALETGAHPRPVVLVWAPLDVARDSELLAQLQRETQRASMLEHPNILRVHGLVSLEAGLARVTEFADGESLRRVLEVRPRLPPAFAALVVADVAMGMHYAHLAGNDDGTSPGARRPASGDGDGLLQRRVQGDGLWRAERGAARAQRTPRAQPPQLHRPRAAHGRARGRHPAHADVFLLGLLLVRVPLGAHALPGLAGPGPGRASAKTLPALPTDVPRALSDVVRLATSKRANERYPNALEFREALVSAVEGNIPPASAFADFLTQLFPPERDARATRRQMLEIGMADLLRRPSLTNTSAAAAPGTSPTRPSGSSPRVTSAAESSSPEYKDVVIEEDDANTIDTVLEITGRHARPGVARPLERDEPSLPPSFVEPSLERGRASAKAREEPEEVTPETPKRRSRVPLIAGALATAAAAAGGLFLWSEHTREASAHSAPVATAPVPQAPPAPAPVAVPPTPPAAPETAQAAEVDAGLPTAAPAPSPTPPETVLAAASSTDGGPPSATGSPPALAVAAGGSLPASPPSTGNESAPPPAPVAETQAVVSTRLQLFVLPPVDVLLEGKRLGRTPLTVPLAPGPYTLELRNPLKGVRTTRSITVQPQGMTTQRVLLGKGTVQVKAPAGSRILLNGRKAGPKLSLYEGQHDLVVTHGARRWQKSIQVEARQRMTIDVAAETP